MPYSFVQMEAEGVYKLVEMCEGKQLVNAEVDYDVKPSVKHLEFHNTCFLSDTELCNISNGLQNLERVCVSAFSVVTDAGYDSFFQNIKQLRTIYVADNRFTDATFESLAKHCSMLQKVFIGCHRPRLTDRVIEAFVKFKTPLVELTTLHNERITSIAIEELVMQCKTLKTLFYAGHLKLHTIETIALSSVDHLLTYKWSSNNNGNFVLPEQSKLRITWLDSSLVRKMNAQINGDTFIE